MKLNSSNKYRMNRAGLFLRKNVLSGRFFVRNTIIALIFATVVGTPIIVLGNNTGDKKATVEASEPVFEVNLSETEMIDENSLSVVKNRIGAEASVKLSFKTETLLAGTEFDFNGKFITKVSSLNIRENADENSEIVGRLFEGAYGTILGEEGDWTKISSGSVTGYVKTEYILKDKEAVKIANDYKVKIATVSESSVRVRDEGSTDSDVIYYASLNEAFPVNADLTNDQWVNIRLADSTYGYISSEFVSVKEGFAEAIPVSRLEDLDRIKEDNLREKVKEEEASNSENSDNDSSYSESENTSSSDNSSSSSDNSSSSDKSSSSSSSNEVSQGTTTEEAVNVDVSDRYLLAAIVYAESGGEPYEGQLAVANVVLNRLRTGYYGNTLSDVIYAPYQFSATSTSAFQNALTTGGSSTSLAAADAALAGTNNIGSLKNFRPTWYIDVSTIEGSYTIINNHVFF